MEGARQEGKGNKLAQELKPAASGLVKTRRLPDWITAFEEFTSAFPSPQLFKKWGAIAILAMAMERKCWIKTNIGELYPNLYIMCLAPPGVGKTIISSTIHEFLGELPDHHTAPSSVSRASLIDALMAASRKIVMPQSNPPVLSFNSLAVVQNEMGVFLPAYDVEFMATLTDLYDGKRYTEKKRSKDIDNRMDAPQLNLFGATTVSYLHDTMPEAAWGHGFLSRTILIYSGEMERRSLWDDIARPSAQKADLIYDLKQIANSVSKFVFEPEAAKAIDNWHKADGPPKPDHPKLQHYATRRTAHVLKLCMVASISRGGDFIITMDDYHRALDWLLEAEIYMQDIFKSMAIGGDAKAIEDTYYWAYKMYSKKQEPIPESNMIEYLQNKVPAHSVERILQLMVRSKLLDKVLDGYRPRAKKDV